MDFHFVYIQRRYLTLVITSSLHLLNSRPSLVTAPCGSWLAPTNAGTPSPEVTGPICRVPSAGFSLSALGFSPGAPVSVLGTVTQDPISCGAFHGLQGSTEHPLRGAIPRVALVLLITRLPRPPLVRWRDGATRPTPKRHSAGLASPLGTWVGPEY